MKVNPNMNQTFREVVSRFVAPAQDLTHKQTVQRLYKQSLKTLDNWIIDRRLWNEEATKIRAEFDQNSHLAPESGCVLYISMCVYCVVRLYVMALWRV